jgi:hypothetical protein
MRKVAVVALLLALPGCGLSPTYQAQQHEKWVAEVERQDDEACRGQQSTPYETCRKLRMQYHGQAAQASSVDLATPMQNAGAALQAAGQPPAFSPPPPLPPIPRAPIQCQTFGNRTTCN